MDDFNTLLYTPACSCGDMWDLYFPLQDFFRSKDERETPSTSDTSEKARSSPPTKYISFNTV